MIIVCKGLETIWDHHENFSVGALSTWEVGCQVSSKMVSWEKIPYALMETSVLVAGLEQV